MTPAADLWTCPYCPLLCDSFRLESLDPPRLAGSDCARALQGLAAQQQLTARPQIDGQDATPDAAAAAAARLLGQSRQPLFGGLATDVAGARALYRLAAEHGAILDAAGGAALMHGLRALQDRGSFTTTLAEVHERADLIVCVTGSPQARYPEIWRRCGDKPRVELAPGDLHRRVATLAALVAGRTVRDPDPELVDLAARLHAARYAVLLWDAVALPEHGSLIVEALNRIVATLNRRTRAAMLPLAGADGAATVNQVHTWLSGLPLRTRAGPRGLEHEPLRHDAQRLLRDGDVDLLLWVSSFGPEPAPPATGLPLILIGRQVPPGCTPAVFIPVSTPGVGADGHLFRTDGVVLMPLHRVRDEALPTTAEAVDAIRSTTR